MDPAAGDDEEIQPLTGKPYFTFIVTGKCVDEVNIPPKFANVLPDLTLTATVACGGREWPMTCHYGKKLKDGWMRFAKDNRIRRGDGCVFELMASSASGLKFRAQILRGGDEEDDGKEEVRPSSSVKNGRGGNAGDPIVLD